MSDNSDKVGFTSPSTPGTPVMIPPTPALKRIDCGTGVSVYHLDRYGSTGDFRSPWALKRLNPRLLNKEHIACRLKKEADVLKKLNHPNIVGFRALINMDDGRQCLAMEECSSSLGNLIENREQDGLGPFPSSIIKRVGLDVAKGLDYLHTECKLLHGDVKSYNVLIKGDFEIAKLCDFGVSISLDDKGYASNPDAEYIGTESWAAAEVLFGGPVTTKADIFSYGLTLYEMIVLSPPHAKYILTDEILSYKNSEDCSSSNFDLDESVGGVSQNGNQSQSDNKENMNHNGTDNMVEKIELHVEECKTENENLKESSQIEQNSQQYSTSTSEDSEFKKGFGTRPSLPLTEMPEDYNLVLKIFYWCTENDYTERPSAQQLVELLETGEMQ